MGKYGNFILGAIIGGLVGAAFGLLFAPNSGEKLRDQLTDYSHAVKGDIKQAALQRRADLEAQIARLRQPK